MCTQLRGLQGSRVASDTKSTNTRFRYGNLPRKKYDLLYACPRECPCRKKPTDSKW